MRGEAHGYQVRQDLLLWAADRWANVKQGSIYHALKKLTSEELLAAGHTEESDLGPDRVVYRITPQGDGEFFYLLSKGLGEVDSGETMFNAALPFITALDRSTLAYLLKARIRQTEGQMSTTQFLMDNTIAAQPGEPGKPVHIREMFRYWNAAAVGVLEWLRDLLARVEAGEYEFADDSPHSFGMPPRR
ncbi:PadR family transcriptional regulator [Actinocrispum wychmicini]|uniref:PadR family transcriptional regulator n=2 Tax=Actinocrispum wychmicini TaxID=1213861 RepID=A0A4R2JFA4_9PSEU|nr:PadR family transcriptional regulator [Actinocrispum wychmicini]